MCKVFLSILLTTLSLHSLGCEKYSEATYASVGWKVFPEPVSHKLSEKEIEERRLDRHKGSYMVQRVCDTGELKSLTKYIEGKVFIHIDYIYESGNLIGKRTTNNEGRVSEYFPENP